MLKNYFLTAWRNLLRNRQTALINIIGLTTAFTCCTLLFLLVQYEYSFDDFHKNKDRIFVVYSQQQAADGIKKGTSMAYPVAPALRSEVAGIQGATSYMYGGGGIKYGAKELEKTLYLVDDDFLAMFTFPVLKGQTQHALSSLSSLVLSKSTADALFGQEDPIGKTVQTRIGGAWKMLTVTAVIQDAPENSTFHFAMLSRIENNGNYEQQKNNWDIQHHPVFVQLAPGITPAQTERQMRPVVKKYNAGNDEYLRLNGSTKDANGDYMSFRLSPFANLHFDSEINFAGTETSKAYLYTMIIIAIAVMVIACFNFINLNVARSFSRAREVGVRKTIGAGRPQIFLQHWIESLLLFLLAVLFSVGAASLLLRPFNDLFTEKLKLISLLQPAVLIALLIGLLVVSLLAGGYPAWLVSRFQAVEVLKGKVSVNRSGYLRNGLIVLQFVMTAIMICSTIVIYQQFRYMRTAPLGFVQESVISIPVKHGENGRRYLNQLRMELASQPQVLSLSGSTSNIGIGEDHSQSAQAIGFTYQGKSINTSVLTVDYDYLKTLGIQVLAGRDFSREYAADTASKEKSVIVSESMARQFGVKDPIGLYIGADTSAPGWKIVGIIPDIHFRSLHEKVQPLTLQMGDKNDGVHYIFVKVRTDNPLQTLNMIRTSYGKLEPGNKAAASYLTENTARWYEKEQRLSKIFFTAAFIAILLSCLGLFAIVSLVMERRRKEIGIRKVLGASITTITRLLSRDFLGLVALAFLIAAPLAWYFLHKWLQDFPYRIDLEWYVFPLAGILTLLIALATVSFRTIRASLANPVDSLRSE